MTGILDLKTRTSLLLQKLPNAAFVFRLDRNGTFLEVVNYPDRSRLWKDPSQHLGKSLEEVLQPELAIDRRHYLNRVVAEKQAITYAYPHPLTPGRFMACTLIPLKGDDDGEIKEVVMAVQDVLPLTPIPDLYVFPSAS